MFDITIPTYHDGGAISERASNVEAAVVWCDDQYMLACRKRGATKHGGAIEPAQEKVNLVLYSKSSCPFCKKVLRYLGNIGKTVPIKDIDDNPNYAKELIKTGGKSQVPCLIINGRPLYESKDIIQWLGKHKNLY